MMYVSDVVGLAGMGWERTGLFRGKGGKSGGTGLGHGMVSGYKAGNGSCGGGRYRGNGIQLEGHYHGAVRLGI